MDTELATIYKNKLINTLDAFDSFCTENGLNYYACGGTAIGAVRHSGIIPWDDDIDVVMLREDYEKLKKLRSKLEDIGYELKTLGDDGYIYAFGKFCDKNTTLIEVEQYPSCVLGVNIDIFPLDLISENMEENEKMRTIFQKKYTKFMYTFHKLSLYTIAAHIYHLQFKELWYLIYYNMLATHERIEEIRAEFIEFDKKWSLPHGHIYYNHSAFYPLKKEMLKKEWFDSYEYLPFEGSRIRIMRGNHEYLTQLFGNYMTPPPSKERKSHHFKYYLNLVEGLAVSEVNCRIKKHEFIKY